MYSRNYYYLKYLKYLRIYKVQRKICVTKIARKLEAGMSRSGNADQNARREKGWEPLYELDTRYRKWFAKNRRLCARLRQITNTKINAKINNKITTSTISRAKGRLTRFNGKDRDLGQGAKRMDKERRENWRYVTLIN